MPRESFDWPSLRRRRRMSRSLRRISRRCNTTGGRRSVMRGRSTDATRACGGVVKTRGCVSDAAARGFSVDADSRGPARGTRRFDKRPWFFAGCQDRRASELRSHIG